MKKDFAYKFRVVFNSVSSNLEYAVCGCPAGHGPKCTCKHLACFCYFIEEFCRHGNINYAESTTSSLQQWHQPRKRLSTACTLNNIKFIKPEYGKENKRVISTNYDPRPQHMHSITPQEITQLQNELTSLGDTTAVALLHVLPSSEAPELIITSESLELPPIPKTFQLKVQETLQNEPQPISSFKHTECSSQFLAMITYSVEDRGQSNSIR